MELSERDKKYKRKVEDALARYSADLYDISSGYNILRYAEKGLLKAVEFESVINQNLMLYSISPEHNGNAAFSILRHAHEGHLSYDLKL
jgi:hypothetical protein